MTAPLITFAPLPLLTSTLGGSIAGLITTLLGALAAVLYFIPSHNLVPVRLGDGVSLLLYIGIGATSSTIVGALRRYAQRTRWQAWQVRHAEERLSSQIERSEEMELQLSAIVNSTTDAIIGKNIRGRVTSWNKGAERMFGYSAEEMLGQTLDRLLPPNAEVEETSILARVLRQKEMVLRSDAVRIAKDGRIIHAEVSLSPILNSKEEVVGCAQIARDVSEIRTLQRQMQQSQKMDAIGQLTGGIAHDFNNLLSIIIGSLDLQQTMIADNPKALQRWNSAHGAAMRAADLTRRLLAFSSMEQLTAVPTQLEVAIRNVVELSRHVLGPEVRLTTTLDDTLPAVIVDPTGLESALLNLAINARDAMPLGGNLSISTSSRDFDHEESTRPDISVTPGRYACISVSDSGTGMSQETLERAFEPFFTTKARGRGTGLGLSMVYGFAKQSHGGVRIYSEPGHGTVVHLYIPFAHQEFLSTETPLNPPHASGSEMILLVDDEEELVRVGKDYLESLGYSVVTAPDGPSALAILRSSIQIDLLLTDVIMGGGMDGMELAHLADEARPALPVIYSSGFSADALSGRTRPLPNSHILQKPYRLADLSAVVRKALDPND